MQYPNEPNTTDEPLTSSGRVTVIRPNELATGADTVVTMRKMVAARKRKEPRWLKILNDMAGEMV